MSLSANLKLVQQRIIQAAKRVGRDPAEVKLVVAGKYADTKTTLQAIKAEAKIIGENREQDLKKKFAVIGHKAQWHFIGHLQRNKVKSIIKIVSLIHSVDSFALAEELEKRLRQTHRKLRALIEVNTSGERSKFGVLPSEATSLITKCAQFKALKIVGLMTMGALVKHPQENRRHFKQLKHLLEQLQAQKIPGTNKLKHLSMGTTQDFEVAIEEGATLVRVGSAIFRD